MKPDSRAFFRNFATTIIAGMILCFYPIPDVVSNYVRSASGVYTWIIILVTLFFMMDTFTRLGHRFHPIRPGFVSFGILLYWAALAEPGLVMITVPCVVLCLHIASMRMLPPMTETI